MTTPIKLSPLYHISKRLGARYVDVEGWRVPHDFGDAAAEAAAAGAHVALFDASARGKLLVEGKQAVGLVNAVWDVDDLAVGAGAEIKPGLIYRLRPDQFFVHTPPGKEAEVLQTLSKTAADDLATTTDVTHGRAELLVLGPASAELLSRLCGLDFSDAAFPNLAARQSNVAKTRQLVLRHDIDSHLAYAVIGGRSLGEYVWETMMEAGRDLGIRAAGQAALDAIVR